MLLGRFPVLNYTHKHFGSNPQILVFDKKLTKIGLLKPAEYTESGYRLCDDAALERLGQILLFCELEFPLKDIKEAKRIGIRISE